MTVEAGLLSLLRERGWSLGVAESLTGGLVVASLVSVPGASLTLRGGVVAYDSAIKTSLLGVDAGLLRAHGAVDPEVARQMADGVRHALAVGGRDADMGISTTGIAGPDSPDGQPVGTVHIGVSLPSGTFVTSHVFEGDRAAIREAARVRALEDAFDALS
ncbi:CinA family protein [Microbacterium lacusdiani]|jgi:nicotinamide-nucleotide amidase